MNEYEWETRKEKKKMKYISHTCSVKKKFHKEKIAKRSAQGNQVWVCLIHFPGYLHHRRKVHRYIYFSLHRVWSHFQWRYSLLFSQKRSTKDTFFILSFFKQSNETRYFGTEEICKWSREEKSEKRQEKNRSWSQVKVWNSPCLAL